MWQFTPFALPSLAAITISLCLVWFGWRRRHAAGAQAFISLNLSLIVWASMQFFSISAVSLESKIFFSKIQYFGIVGAPLCWLLFAITYTGHGRILRSPLSLLLGLIPATTLILVNTNELHGLIWSSIKLNPSAPFSALSLGYGLWFAVQLFYSYICVLVGTVLFVVTLARSQHNLKGLLATIAAPFIVIFSNVLYLSSWNLLPYIDITPLSFVIGGGIMGWALLRLGLLDILPIARSAVINGLGDAVIALNQEMKIVDINPAAALLFGRTQKQLLGQSFIEAADKPLSNLISDDDIKEIIITQNSKELIYEVKRSELKDGNDTQVGRLIVLRDITLRKEAEHSLLQIQRELKEANTELSRLAGTDSLTGLANRRVFIERIKQEVARSHRTGELFGLIMFDIDYFKQVNDAHGHLVGDRVLIAVADKIKNTLRVTDFAARLGGEEFAIVAINANLEGLNTLSERLLEQIATETYKNDNGKSFQITASIGIASFDNDDVESLIRRADEALYKAKREGRNRVCLATK